MNKRKGLLVIIIGIMLLALINFYPTFNLKSRGMKSIETKHFVLYSEKNDQSGSGDIAWALEKAYEKITKEINFKRIDKTKVYVYPDLTTFHSKKYGLVGIIISPDWYIGDNIKDKVLIVTPRDPGSQHSYDSVVAASVHEFVHTLIYQINRNCPYWLNNGLAGYFADQKPPKEQVENLSLAALEGMRTDNPIKFGQVNGYQYSYIYVDFLNKKYGMKKVMELVRAPEEYQSIFGKSLLQLDKECILYLRNEYLKNKHQAYAKKPK